MLFLRCAQPFFLFGTLVAAIPVPGLNYDIQGQTIELGSGRLLPCHIPRTAQGFWQRDPAEAKVS